LGVDADDGTPDLGFTDEGDARVATRRCPYRPFAVLAGGVSNLICEADNELWPLRQVLAPNGMIMKCFRNTGKPWQRSWVGRCGLWEAPVEYGGHVFRGVEFSSGGGCLQVEERVLTALRRQCEQVCPQRRPGRLPSEFGDDLVGLAVEHLNNLGANQLLGRDMEPIGVALNGLEQPGSRLAEFSQQCAGWGGGLVTSEDLMHDLGRRAGCDGFGSNDGVRVAVADDL
jgi:hypothetical protein